ncbi:MAG: transcriptional regulator [Cystobacterineae bacterium]|nr:transcriptional regulator [Cystobacterineae bacterium]
MAPSTPLPFSIGETVVYPNQGLCNVTGIEEKEVANQKLLFIHLVRLNNDAKVMVPTEKALQIGLRKVATHAEVLSVLEFLKSDSDKASLDWKTRARINTEHMARGSLMGLAEVVKALQVLSELRPLPTKERELYNNARSMLVEEMAASLQMEPCEAEDTIDLVLFPVGKARPRRTLEEFQLAFESPMDEDLLSLDEDEFLEKTEEETEEQPEEEELEESLSADEINALKQRAAPQKETKKNKTKANNPPKTSKTSPQKNAAALAKKTPAPKTKKEAPSSASKTKAAPKTDKAASRTSIKKKAL